MKAHCFQHEPFEEMAAIETWLMNNKFSISLTKLYEPNHHMPSPNNIDWLILMGGGMSVNDEQQYPWLIAEKEFIRLCIDKGKVIIGICLGSQLIANALGARVYPNNQKEIGWFPIQKVKNTQSKIFQSLPDEITVFHWHGETFGLPAGAELIASSEVCNNQIFTVKNNVVGFQCHLETTADSLSTLSENCRAELIPAKYIQSEAEMIRDENKYAAQMHKALFEILDQILKSNC